MASCVSILCVFGVQLSSSQKQSMAFLAGGHKKKKKKSHELIRGGVGMMVPQKKSVDGIYIKSLTSPNINVLNIRHLAD